MQLVVISGLSGAGKSVALHSFEDNGYYCVDNLPLSLLPSFVQDLKQSLSSSFQKFALVTDIRDPNLSFDQAHETINLTKDLVDDLQIIYLTAATSSLLQRFSATRRKHPLHYLQLPLGKTIEKEQEYLQPLRSRADLIIDTTHLHAHELREKIKTRLLGAERSSMQILLMSFGFKAGLPADTDFCFDARCLPNPYWESGLRALSGLDQAVISYFQSQQLVRLKLESIEQYLALWVPHFEASDRSYLNIAVGCTGGRHRSVYLIEQLSRGLKSKYPNTVVNHRDL